MESKMVAVFDFDGTLTKIDSYSYLLGKVQTHRKVWRITLYNLIKPLFKSVGTSNDLLKVVSSTLILRGISKTFIEGVAEQFVRDGLICNNIFDILLDKLRSNYRVLIVSASPQFYIQKIIEYYLAIKCSSAVLPSLEVLGSRVLFDLTMGFQKFQYNLYRERKRQVLHSMGIDRLNILYTDSDDDYPLMEISDTVFMIKDCKSFERL